MFLKSSKCTLNINEVEVFNHWVTLKDATLTVEKLRIVHDWEAPNSVKDIRFFLGFANYYRRFVIRYAGFASPLTLLTKKNIK